MLVKEFEKKTKVLIDSLKAVCASYGLGNDGNEFKIITQIFLYKFLNDKFISEIKKINKNLNSSLDLISKIKSFNEEELEMLLLQLPPGTANLKTDNLIQILFERQNEKNFSKLFDETLLEISKINNDIFSVKTDGGAKIKLFDRVSEFIADISKRDEFCRALINKLVEFSFENIFTEKYDFYATIFEYLISDYNKDSGGKYAEYYTPHAVAKIMASILVPDKSSISNVSCYDPSAGSGTLLMNLAHAIGENSCAIYSQDISQKSSSLLRLNLILNNLVHSIQNVIQGNTLSLPFHKDDNGIKRFDYIVSNPPFKMDFSDFRNDLDTKQNNQRFFAGIPNIPAKAKDKMPIYQLFIQHIIFSLSDKGKAAVVVPTGFVTAKGIDLKIRKKLIDEDILSGVISMPSNIFATTGTNVSILFFDKSNKEEIILIDASNLGTTVKEGKNQKTILSIDEEIKITETFKNKESIEKFSVLISKEKIQEKNYSFSAGQYFDVKIDHIDISYDEFLKKINNYSNELKDLFENSKELDNEIQNQLKRLKLDEII